MDATFTPRIMSKRGLLLGGEFRYLQEKHGGRIQAEILPDDKAVADDKNNTRGAFLFSQAVDRRRAGHSTPTSTMYRTTTTWATWVKVWRLPAEDTLETGSGTVYRI